MIDYEEICIINIERMNRNLSPYQKQRLIEEERKGEVCLRTEKRSR